MAIKANIYVGAIVFCVYNEGGNHERICKEVGKIFNDLKYKDLNQEFLSIRKEELPAKATSEDLEKAEKKHIEKIKSCKSKLCYFLQALLLRECSDMDETWINYGELQNTDYIYRISIDDKLNLNITQHGG